MTNVKPRARGRPPKNATLNLRKFTSAHNINNKNIWPPSLIKASVPVKIQSSAKKYNVIFSSNTPQIFETILDMVKGRYTHIMLSFDENGIVIKHVLYESNNDIVKFECRILPKKLLEYKYSVPTVIKFKIDILHNIFKNIKKNTKFTLQIREIRGEYDRQMLMDIVYRINNKKKHYSFTIPPMITYDPVIMKKDYKYDIIALYESESFTRDCREYKNFSDDVTISYNKKLLYFTFQKDKSWGTTTMNPICGHTTKGNAIPNPLFVFLRTSKIPFTASYKLSSFLKYTKCSKFSTIIKLYLSTDHPLIIEYDINPGIGVMQIIVDHI